MNDSFDGDFQKINPIFYVHEFNLLYFLELFAKKNKLEQNIESVKSSNDLTLPNSQQTDAMIGNLLTSFDSNNSPEYSYPIGIDDDNSTNSPIISEGIFNC